MMKHYNHGTYGTYYKGAYIPPRWPWWLAEADILRCHWEISPTGVFHWLGGVWLGGVWREGLWVDGEWRGGTWVNGAWRGGLWLGGTWLDGVWMSSSPHPNERKNFDDL